MAKNAKATKVDQFAKTFEEFVKAHGPAAGLEGIISGGIVMLLMAGGIYALSKMTTRPEIIISGALALGVAIISGVLIYCHVNLLIKVIFLMFSYVSEFLEMPEDASGRQK